MKPTILKVFSNYPDRSFNLKKNDENHLIRISNVENQNIPQIKCELLSNDFIESSYATIDSTRDISVLEDYYRFQERRNAFMDSKKSTPQNQPSQHKRVYERPNFSYTQLIYMAIESSSLNALTVNDIYKWCELNFPYYANAIHGWKNSLRHNLSINKCFKKITKIGQGGRGSLWIVDPREKQHLVSTMHRSNVTSFSTPSFLIHQQQQQQHNATEQPRNGHINDVTAELPPTDDSVDISDCHEGAEAVSPLRCIEEKPSYSWTDTRLLRGDCGVPLSPGDCSLSSETDYNDWKRSMISPDPIFPVRRHKSSARGAMCVVVTPPGAVEHSYSVPPAQADGLTERMEEDHRAARHLFGNVSGASDVSYSTSSDYNDEEWPRTPSPAVSVGALQPPVVTVAVQQLQQLQAAPRGRQQQHIGKAKTKSKRGRPRNSDRLQRQKAQSAGAVGKAAPRGSRYERINNMFQLNSFINSL